MGGERSCGIPVLLLICSGALISVCGSVASGLIMYFQSLSSLEKTVAQTSASDLQGLKSEILDVMQMVRKNADVNFLSSLELAKNVSDVRGYEKAQVGKGLAAAKTIPGLSADGLLLFSHVDPDGMMRDPRPLVSVQWLDPLHDGDFELYTWMSRYEPLPAIPGATTSPGPQDLYHVDPVSLKKKWFSISETGSGHSQLLLDWVPGEPNLPSGFHAVKASPAGTPSPALAERWREGMLWYSETERYVYAFESLDIVYRPPPPPHPWSRYRAIVKYSQFLYSSWRVPLQAYALRAPQGTHVVVYDPVVDLVYASTQGGELVDQSCSTDNLLLGLSETPCAFRTANLSRLLRAAVTEMAGVPVQQMVKRSLDGEEHFVRKDIIFDNLHITWLSPVSSVQGEVNDALVLLIVFTLLVLVFDIVTAALEVLLVALPLRDVERAILLAGSMMTGEAQRVLAPYQTKTFMVSEMRGLVGGMSTATAKLHEFRAFMPQSLCVDSESAEQSPPSEPSRESSSSMSTIGSATSCTMSMCQSQTSAFAAGLVRRDVSLVMCNIRGFHKLPPDGVLQMHSDYIAATTEQARHHRGIVQDMSGDRVLLSFGAVAFLPSHQMKAVRCVAMLQILQESKDINFGVACGMARTGNMGCATLKKHCVLGAVACDVRTIERCGNAWNLRVMCDTTITDAVSGTYNMRAVAQVQLQGTVCLLYQLVGACLSQGHAEWMYELENAAAGNPHAASNRAMRLIYERNMDTAADAIDDDAIEPHAVSMYKLAVQLGKPPIFDVLAVPRLPP
eukprot:TRINITY_DN2044_c0_g1_i15.p1 TRINITY_DN2044_c0_g1~~TRINITY_DN2044_c0_g1_i15.p1  ORF type:complete len:801 (+),score=274.15 TRINITY_DN2044_c0_g1_i15:38-2404(+)